MPRPTLDQHERELLRAVSMSPASDLRRVLSVYVEAIGYRGLRHVLSKGFLVASGQKDEFRARAHRARLDATRYEQAKGLLLELEGA